MGISPSKTDKVKVNLDITKYNTLPQLHYSIKEEIVDYIITENWTGFEKEEAIILEATIININFQSKNINLTFEGFKDSNIKPLKIKKGNIKTPYTIYNKNPNKKLVHVFYNNINLPVLTNKNTQYLTINKDSDLIKILCTFYKDFDSREWTGRDCFFYKGTPNTIYINLKLIKEFKKWFKSQVKMIKKDQYDMSNIKISSNPPKKFGLRLSIKYLTKQNDLEIQKKE